MEDELDGPVLGHLVGLLQGDPDVEGVPDLQYRVLHQGLDVLI